MNIMQKILAAIQSGTSTPGGAPAPAPTYSVGDGSGMDNHMPVAPPAKPPSIMDAIGGILAPEAGSFWQSALANGLPDARAGQAAYRAGLQKTADEHAKAEEATALAVANRKKTEAGAWKENFITTPTGSVLKPGSDGTPTTAYEPPTKPSETERLISLWERTPKGPFKDLLERAIKGAQYAPEYIQRDTARKIAIAKSRPVGSGRGRAPPKPPAGAVEF